MKIVGLPTVIDIPANKILDAAKDKLTVAIVLGRDTNGKLYLSTSSSDTADINLLIDKAKNRILE